MTKVILIQDYNGLSRGTVLQDCVIVEDFDGNEYWEGIHSPYKGSYFENVPVEYCEFYDEEKHDPMYRIKQFLLDPVKYKERYGDVS